MPACTVCGKDVESAAGTPEEGYGSESYAPARVEYGDDLHYFCSEEHRQSFEDDPDQYLADGE